jgi:DNA-binding PadR family transcriptional regulator
MGFLCDGPLHGYALVELLKKSPLMNGTKPDPPGVYRLLASLEKQGLVGATWKESTKGPSKCQYGLTVEGRTCLVKWIETLDTYQKSLVELIGMLRKAKA